MYKPPLIISEYPYNSMSTGLDDLFLAGTLDSGQHGVTNRQTVRVSLVQGHGIAYGKCAFLQYAQVEADASRVHERLDESRTAHLDA